MEEDLVVPIDEPNTAETTTTAALEFQVEELKKIVESYAKREKLLQKQYSDYVIKTHETMRFIGNCVLNCAESIRLATKNMETDND
jgi:hypothetical protein